MELLGLFGSFTFYSISLQQSIDGGFTAPETFVEHHRILGTTLRKDMLAERLGCSLVKDAMTLKY
jgi:hypothetical protein